MHHSHGNRDTKSNNWPGHKIKAFLQAFTHQNLCESRTLTKRKERFPGEFFEGHKIRGRFLCPRVTVWEDSIWQRKLSNSNCLVLDQNRIRKIVFEIMNMACPFIKFCPFAGSMVQCCNIFVTPRNATAERRHTKQELFCLSKQK